MKWNMRLTAANRGIWKASEMQRLLAERGLEISLGKMSKLWAGAPASMKLSDLDVICAVLGCEIGELLLPEPLAVAQPAEQDQPKTAAAAGSGPVIAPRPRSARSLPPR
jgi:DNA-binding Xre family transcriptional regulator